MGERDDSDGSNGGSNDDGKGLARPLGPPAELNQTMGWLDGEYIGGERSLMRSRYRAGMHMCHSGGVVQGGFVTGWIDATMAAAVMHSTEWTMTTLSLEIKVSFLLPAAPGVVVAEAWVTRMGRRIAFLEGQLLNEEGEVLATGTSTVKLAPIPQPDSD